jgi:hypothetical protein
MDRQQAEAEYAAAAERAQVHGLTVVADGYGVDGTHYWFVPSATGGDVGDWHRVWIAGGRFQCSCSGGQHGKVCMHKAVARMRYQVEEAALQQAEAQAREPKPARTDGRVVTYDGRPGRGSRCASCSKSFTQGEHIVLLNGAAFHEQCVASTQLPGDDAPVACDNKPFSIFKQ